MTEETQVTPEEAARRNFEMRSRALGDGIARTLDASGAPMTLTIEALAFATALLLTHLAQRDKALARVMADNLANSLLALCEELGISSGDNETESAGAPN